MTSKIGESTAALNKNCVCIGNPWKLLFMKIMFHGAADEENTIKEYHNVECARLDLLIITHSYEYVDQTAGKFISKCYLAKPIILK